MLSPRYREQVLNNLHLRRFWLQGVNDGDRLHKPLLKLMLLFGANILILSYICYPLLFFYLFYYLAILATISINAC